tara:strand:- start:682 stop:888 length:207 start_codon:yes stop_codon:yes gene_type:complete
MTTLLKRLSDNKKPQGSIISNKTPKQEQVLIIEAVFWGISGSYSAILGPKIYSFCVIVTIENYLFSHI